MIPMYIPMYRWLYQRLCKFVVSNLRSAVRPIPSPCRRPSRNSLISVIVAGPEEYCEELFAKLVHGNADPGDFYSFFDASGKLKPAMRGAVNLTELEQRLRERSEPLQGNLSASFALRRKLHPLTSAFRRIPLVQADRSSVGVRSQACVRGYGRIVRIAHGIAYRSSLPG